MKPFSLVQNVSEFGLHPKKNFEVSFKGLTHMMSFYNYVTHWKVINSVKILLFVLPDSMRDISKNKIVYLKSKSRCFSKKRN